MAGLPAFWAHPMVRVGLSIGMLALLALAVSRFALQQRDPPDRCPPGMVAVESRCCGAGQALKEGRCVGRASSCAVTQDLNDDGQCVARFGVVSLPGGVLDLGAADWEGQAGERFPRSVIEPFRIDVTEVTYERFRGKKPLPAGVEPGAPVTSVSVGAAADFCSTQHGRLPTAAEWVWAAAGPGARRFAWGNSGLVCRRAVFGLSKGPCAQAGTSAELSGSRPDGASPEGVLDLTGNVAEWTSEAGRSFSVRGGSFRSQAAADLKSWSSEPAVKSLHIGFRCAYAP